MDALTLKIILALVMVLLTILFGLLPLKVLLVLRKRALSLSTLEEPSEWPSLVLCLLSCFTGGVFLATCFLHLLPEVNLVVIDVKREYNWDTDYPIAELIACCGFFLVFFVEEVVVSFLQKGHKHSPLVVEFDEHDADHQQNVLDQLQSSGESMPNKTAPMESTPINQPPTPPTIPHDNSNAPLIIDRNLSIENRTKNGLEKGRSHSDDEGGRIRNESGGLKVRMSPPAPGLNGRAQAGHHCCGAGAALNLHGQRTGSPMNEICTNVDLAEPERCEGPCEGFDGHPPPILMTSRPHAHSHVVRSLTLLLALSFHSVIEGLTFGVQSTVDKVLVLFLTLIIHKCIVAFSVGLQLARTHAHQLKLVIMSIGTLALMSPVGCAIGISVESAVDKVLVLFLTLIIHKCIVAFSVGLQLARTHAHQLKLVIMSIGTLALMSPAGCAIGISVESTVDKVLVLFLTLIIHKCIVAFSVGLQLARTHAHQLKLVIMSIGTLALMSPVGCAIGISVEQSGIDNKVKDVVLMVFEGAAVGTFLYVTFFEVFIHERDNQHPNMLKLFVTILGFALIGSLRVLEHDHDINVALNNTVASSDGHDH